MSTQVIIDDDDVAEHLLGALSTTAPEAAAAAPGVLDLAHRHGLRSLRALMQSPSVSTPALEAAIWAHAGFVTHSIMDEALDPDLLRRLPAALAREWGVLPLGWAGDSVRLAVVDPVNTDAHERARTRLGNVAMDLVLVERDELDAAIQRAEELVVSIVDLAEDEDEEALRALQTVDDPEAAGKYAQAVQGLIEEAVALRGSDLHVEPEERHVRIRVRVDGVLQVRQPQPLSVADKLVSRLKVMASLDIGEHRLPQTDGHARVEVAGRRLDLRVSIVPQAGLPESAVVRIQDPAQSAGKDLHKLGFSPALLEVYERLVKLTHGAVVVTGPTGSGKSTTLYATLKRIATSDKKSLSVEDPVEVRVDGVIQTQVNPLAGYTFAAAVPAFVRCDPDIIMVGEVRDRETAVAAVNAATTGHLVLTTLHTNSAAGAPGRLIELGVEPYLVSDALRAVLAQRLARLLCRHCREPYEPPAEVLANPDWAEPPTELYRAVGCRRCSGLGYQGRVALGELLVVDDAVKRAISKGADSAQLSELARAQGLPTLRQDGLAKAASGATSYEEIGRVLS
ncbi:MAG: Flp pilus assembly complex ATPase component TadA [Acidimicrobiia bacterium]|nr:Flp pilus assembly complex ATPase component TadA [Acidimicrobiia bacterium]